MVQKYPNWSKMVQNQTKKCPNGSGITRSPGLVLRDLPKLQGTTGYTTSKLSPHHTGDGKARLEEGREEEQVGEGWEEVGYTRGPVCSAVLTDLPKLRGTTGYFTTNLNTTPP